jgi:hypothetical protein
MRDPENMPILSEEPPELLNQLATLENGNEEQGIFNDPSHPWHAKITAQQAVILAETQRELEVLELLEIA